MNLIKITNISNPSKFDDYVASSLVDVVYIEEISNNTVILSLEEGIDLNNLNDKQWVTGLIEQAITDCKELSAKIVFQ